MSGPVWRLIRNQPSTCTECGAKIEAYRACGNVVDDVFRATHRYCEECYKALGRLLDQVA